MHGEEGREVGKYQEVEFVKEKKMHVEEWDRSEDEDEQELGGEEIPPFVGLDYPPLPVANERFSLNDADDEKGPEEDHGRRDVTAGSNEK